MDFVLLIYSMKINMMKMDSVQIIKNVMFVIYFIFEFNYNLRVLILDLI